MSAKIVLITYKNLEFICQFEETRVMIKNDILGSAFSANYSDGKWKANKYINRHSKKRRNIVFSLYEDHIDNFRLSFADNYTTAKIIIDLKGYRDYVGTFVLNAQLDITSVTCNISKLYKQSQALAIRYYIERCETNKRLDEITDKFNDLCQLLATHVKQLKLNNK